MKQQLLNLLQATLIIVNLSFNIFISFSTKMTSQVTQLLYPIATNAK